VTFIFVFRLKMNVYFRFRFVFGLKWNFILVGIFIYGRKWKMLFGRPLVHHKKVLVLVLRCKVLVLILNTRLGLCLGLGLERILKLGLVLVLKLRSWSWKKVLITSLVVWWEDVFVTETWTLTLSKRLVTFEMLVWRKIRNWLDGQTY